MSLFKPCYLQNILLNTLALTLYLLLLPASSSRQRSRQDAANLGIGYAPLHHPARRSDSFVANMIIRGWLRPVWMNSTAAVDLITALTTAVRRWVGCEIGFTS
jgi:hypothetical protein